jgi:aminoglycoside phosphotransferase (APT) family kinase protein
MPRKMHADEVDTDPPLVRRLLADQFPQWADLPIDRVGYPWHWAVHRWLAGESVNVERIADPVRAARSPGGADRVAHRWPGATWARGRGCALSFALIALPYYMHTNPVFVRDARHVIREVLADQAM